MPESPSLFHALETICRDSLEASVVEVSQMEDEGEITSAVQRLIHAYDALEGISDSEPALDVGPLGRAYLAKQRDKAQRALDGLPYV